MLIKRENKISDNKKSCRLTIKYVINIDNEVNPYIKFFYDNLELDIKYHNKIDTCLRKNGKKREYCVYLTSETYEKLKTYEAILLDELYDVIKEVYEKYQKINQSLKSLINLKNRPEKIERLINGKEFD